MTGSELYAMAVGLGVILSLGFLGWALTRH
jgi:hypothetical protein